MKRLLKRFPRVLALVALAFGALIVVPPHVSLARPRPNIIVILVDTLRADYLGAYGFEGDISPSLDALAEESVVFTHCVSQAPWTKPSVASLFTSMSPLTHRVTDHNGSFWRNVAGSMKTSSLPDQAQTLAESLQAAGYQTAAWIGNGWITRPLGFAQGFEKFQAPTGEERVMEAGKLWRPALDWLTSRQDERPYFLYLHLMDTHGPWRWNQEEWSLIRKSPSLGADRTLTRREIQNLRYLKSLINKPALEARLGTWRGAYGAGVRVLDERIGPFLSKLRAGGFLSNTILVFTADHGEELLEHEWWGHGYSLHSDQLRVPLIIRLPGGRDGGRRVEGVVSLIDVMPTLLSAARARLRPEGMQGHDLWNLLRGKDTRSLSEYAFATGVKASAKTVAIEDAEYKLIWDYPDGRVQLFDTRADYLEQHDESAENKDVVTRLKLRLRAQIEALEEKGTLLETDSPLSDEEMERLRSLGYIH